jgi:hypothetical protein
MTHQFSTNSSRPATCEPMIPATPVLDGPRSLALVVVARFGGRLGGASVMELRGEQGCQRGAQILGNNQLRIGISRRLLRSRLRAEPHEQFGAPGVPEHARGHTPMPTGKRLCCRKTQSDFGGPFV